MSAPAETSEAPKTLLFIGNLPFRTTAEDLGKLLREKIPIKSVNIISRGRRSLGYGFVEVETIDIANKGVQLFNKFEIEGREINVEVAKVRDPSAPKKPAAEPRQPREPREARPPREPREARPPRERRSGKSAEGAAPAANGGAAAGAEKAKRRPRRSRTSETRAPRVAYEHAVFVANLPFSVTDEGLKELLSTPAGEAKEARVARRFGRSKGYGFVEFASDAARDAAIKAKDNAEIEGRQISVRIARKEAPEPADAQ